MPDEDYREANAVIDSCTSVREPHATTYGSRIANTNFSLLGGKYVSINIDYLFRGLRLEWQPHLNAGRKPSRNR